MLSEQRAARNVKITEFTAESARKTIAGELASRVDRDESAIRPVIG